MARKSKTDHLAMCKALITSVTKQPPQLKGFFIDGKDRPKSYILATLRE